jgi:hypothetical protein
VRLGSVKSSMYSVSMTTRQIIRFLGRSSVAAFVFWAALGWALHLNGTPEEFAYDVGWKGPSIVLGSVSPQTGLCETIPWEPQPVDEFWRRVWTGLRLCDPNAGKDQPVWWDVNDTFRFKWAAEGFIYRAPLPRGLRVVHHVCVAVTLLLGPLLAAIAVYHILTRRVYGVFHCPSCREPLRGLTGFTCPKCEAPIPGMSKASASSGPAWAELTSGPASRAALKVRLSRVSGGLTLVGGVFILCVVASSILTKPLLLASWDMYCRAENPSLTDRAVRRISSPLWHCSPWGRARPPCDSLSYLDCSWEMPKAVRQAQEAFVGTIRTSWILVVALLIYHRVVFRSMAPAPYPSCRDCGYPLIGLSEPRCPECGLAIGSGSPRSRAGPEPGQNVDRPPSRSAEGIDAKGTDD